MSRPNVKGGEKMIFLNSSTRRIPRCLIDPLWQGGNVYILDIRPHYWIIL